MQIEIEPERIGLRYPVEVGLVGDSRGVLERILPLLEYHTDRTFLESAQEGMRKWWQLMEEQGTRADVPMKPQVLAWELGRLLRDDAIVSCDSGTVATWWARHIPVRRGQMHSISGTLASMACGLNYAIAAQLAYPDRQCVAFVGDGGLSMLMGELSTAAKYRLPIRVIVVKNNTLGQIKWEQLVFLGNPEYGCELEPIDFVQVARACGVAGFLADDPARCGEVLDEAFAAPGPSLVEAVVDPLTAPLPAKITPRQAAKFAEALARGTPDAGAIFRTAIGDKLREMI